MFNGPKRNNQKNLSVEKAKDFKQSIKMLIIYCKPYYFLIIVALILAMISAICTIINPNFLKEITNLITEGLMTGINVEKIKSISVFLVIIYLISAIFSYLQQYIMAVVTNKFSKALRRDITIKINKMPLKYFDKNSYGDILSRITNDVDNITMSLNQSLGSLVSALTLLLGSIIMMFLTNYLMAITAILSSVLGFLFMGVVISKSQKHFELLQEEIGNLNGHIEEIYSGFNVVKLYNGKKEALKEFDEINDRLYDHVEKSQFLSGLMHPMMGFIGNIGYVSVCIVGALLTMNNVIDFGVIVAFIMYVRLFTQPLNQIAQIASSFQSCAAASERVFEFLKEEEMPDERKLTTKLKKEKVIGNVLFDRVKFGYNESKLIIKDFNVAIKSGAKVAIVGQTGAGKTTIVNLLMKFYDITDGDIKIDGISIKDLTRENIHELFVMVLQDSWLFEGTIKDNIRFNNENISDEKIIEVCKSVGLHHFIKSLPDGYETVLTDNDLLSLGQKQLLTIARAMILDAPFLILDEATSSVDTRTEELVQKAMDKLMKGRTSFIIAHRLSTIRNADLILLLENGNIIEQGSHDELIKLNGKYKKLYNSQFEK